MEDPANGMRMDLKSAWRKWRLSNVNLTRRGWCMCLQSGGMAVPSIMITGQRTAGRRTTPGLCRIGNPPQNSKSRSESASAALRTTWSTGGNEGNPVKRLNCERVVFRLMWCAYRLPAHISLVRTGRSGGRGSRSRNNTYRASPAASTQAHHPSGDLLSLSFLKTIPLRWHSSKPSNYSTSFSPCFFSHFLGSQIYIWSKINFWSE